MVALTVVAAMCLVAVSLVLVAAPLVRVTGERDAPAVLVSRIRRLLPDGRADWGSAMAGELDRIERRRERWRFAVGSVVAMLLLPSGPARAKRLATIGATSVVAGCVAVTVATFVRFPALWSSRHVGTALVLLAVLLALSMVVVLRTAPGPGLLGGAVIAGCWCLLGVATDLNAGPGASDGVLLLIAVVSLAVGLGRPRRSVPLTAAVAGPVVFLLWAAGTLIGAGGPYDPGLVRDFPGSGMPDIATYAVSDGLGSAISLLLLVPLATTALTGVGAVVGRRLRRRTA